MCMAGNVMYGQVCAPTATFSGAGTSAFTLIDQNGAAGGTISKTNGIQLNNVLGAHECRGYVNVGALNDTKFSAEVQVKLTAGSQPGHIAMGFTAGILDVVSSANCPDQTTAQNCVYTNTNQSEISVFILSNNADLTSGVNLYISTKVGAANHVTSAPLAIPAAAVGDFTIRFERISATQGRLSYLNSATMATVASMCVAIPAEIVGLNTLQSGVNTGSSSARSLTGTFDNFRVYNNCTIKTLPAPAVNPVTICAGTTASLTANTATPNPTYSWFNAAAGGASIGNGATFVSPVLNAGTTYYASYSDQCGQLSPRTAGVVTVNPATVAGILNSDLTVCPGSNSGTLNLVNFVGSIKRWESSTDNFTTVTSIANTSNLYNYSNITKTTKFRVVVQAGTCSVLTSNVVTITVDPTVAVGGTIAGSATVCASSNSGTLTLSGYTGAIVWWEVSSDNFLTKTIVQNTTATQAYGNLPGTRQFRALVKSGACATAYSTTATIQVSAPTVPGVVSSSASVCKGSNFGTLTLTGQIGSVKNWESSTDNFATKTIIANTSTTLNYTNLNSTISYRAVVQSGVCALGYSTAAKITIIQPPVVAAITGSATVCKNQITEFESTTTGGVWSSSNTAIATVKQTGVVRGIAAGSATISYTVTVGICQTTVTKVITVNDVVSFAINGPSPLCAGTSGNTFSVSPVVVGADYTWNIQNGADIGVTFPVNGSTSCKLNIPGKPAETTFILRCQGLNACGASPIVSKTITLNAAVPTPDVKCSDATNCTNLSVTNNAGYAISWKVDGVQIGTGTSVVRPIGKTVYCYYTSPQGCSSYGYYSPSYICTAQKKADAIEVLEDPQFMVYPNPTEGILNFTTDGYKGQATIYNLLGEVVEVISLDASKTTYHVSMENKAQGTYMIKFTGGVPV
ncbi:MAG: T9SS type A sorting domain-containing protein [Bacteroidetes bacterium]|nr:T9SS type A sorting domain-containing protein [Bacteroidota bacterium]